MTLDEIILKAIPFETCPIQEGYNKNRRTLLKQRVEAYIAGQLEAQFNARRIPATTENHNGLGENAH